MPAVPELLQRWEGTAVHQFESTVQLARRDLSNALHALIARVNIPFNSTSPAGLIEANTVDPWKKSGKYALGWVYFGIILVVATSFFYVYHSFSDRIRCAINQDEVPFSSVTSSPSDDYEMAAFPYPTDKSTNKLFPRITEKEKRPRANTNEPVNKSGIAGFRPVLLILAATRFFFYRTIPDLKIRKGWRPIVFPSLSVLFIGFAGVAFSLLYTFVPQPLFWQSIQYGSPPMAIRSGMLAVALIPWVIGTAMKANIISLLTGIGHERLNVFHRWGSYLILLLSLIHMIPFYITPITGAQNVPAFSGFFKQHFYVYGTGIAAFVPLAFLAVHSLPVLRRRMYELFLALHWIVAIVFIGCMFWHCNNYLTSYSYLYASVTIWVTSWMGRVFYTNFLNPFKMSWLIGDECAIQLYPDTDAVKITIPTMKKWKPGQFVYIRMPGISVFESHPFTIASLCSDDFPSEYGEEYRDMLLLFRPFGGFTKRVVESAMQHDEFHTYRAFIDGPYGGMRRRIESFDNVVLIAGGSGITALVSQLLDLIKRMRDGKAVTQDIQVIWAMKRPETIEWFREELRICRECAPPESVRCQFFITSAKRQSVKTHRMTAQTAPNHIRTYLHDKADGFFMDIAEKRSSYISKRNSAYIQGEADGDEELEKELRQENEDVISALPQAHVVETKRVEGNFSYPRPLSNGSNKGGRDLADDIKTALQSGLPDGVLNPSAADRENFDFGFPSTPTDFQKNLMRFAFLPAAKRGADGWSTEYGRPDLPYMLRQMSKTWGKRTCVFVCGPPSMRVTVASTVASLQSKIFSDPEKEEIFLHADNYSL